MVGTAKENTHKKERKPKDASKQEIKEEKEDGEKRSSNPQTPKQGKVIDLDKNATAESGKSG